MEVESYFEFRRYITPPGKDDLPGGIFLSEVNENLLRNASGVKPIKQELSCDFSSDMYATWMSRANSGSVDT